MLASRLLRPAGWIGSGVKLPREVDRPGPTSPAGSPQQASNRTLPRAYLKLAFV